MSHNQKKRKRAPADEEEAAHMYCLLSTVGETVIQLSGEEDFTIGRGGHCSHQIEDPFISVTHCTLSNPPSPVHYCMLRLHT